MVSKIYIYITTIDYIFKYIKMVKLILNYNDILQYYDFFLS